MRLDHARHQHRAAAIDHRCAGAIEPRRRRGYRGDALAFDPHLARKRRRAGAVENPDIREQDWGCHGASRH